MSAIRCCFLGPYYIFYNSQEPILRMVMIRKGSSLRVIYIKKKWNSYLMARLYNNGLITILDLDHFNGSRGLILCLVLCCWYPRKKEWNSQLYSVELETILLKGQSHRVGGRGIRCKLNSGCPLYLVQSSMSRKLRGYHIAIRKTHPN